LSNQDFGLQDNYPTEASSAITVREFISDPSLGLDFQIVQENGLDNEIRSPRIQRLGMALAGFSGYVNSDRIQIFGLSELNYFKNLKPEKRSAAINRLSKHKICCIVVTKGLGAPEELIEFCAKEKIPLLKTSALSSPCVESVIEFLEKRLAPIMTIHGVLLEIFGLGVLLLGPSGIGKSECALELIMKGHSLIADDFVEIRRKGVDKLIGQGGKALKHFMELRGIGIVSVEDLFGVSATGISQDIDFAVKLEHWNSEAEYDRLGFDQANIEFMSVKIPVVTMPVAPGRNIAALVELAARMQLLRRRGLHPVKEFM
jgi:HPr kinase/phosphorylase